MGTSPTISDEYLIASRAYSAERSSDYIENYLAAQ